MNIAKMSLKLEDGGIYINNSLLSFENEKIFKTSVPIEAHLDLLQYNGYNTYSIILIFLEQKFNFSVTFFNNKLYYNGVGLIWNSGRAFNKGYDATEKDIIKDISELTDLISSNYRIEPSLSEYNESEFKFLWGKIICGGSLKTPVASITIKFD